MTHIAILGGGRVAMALATGLAKAGHQVALGVRNLDKVVEGATAAGITPLPMDQAAASAEVIFNAMPGEVSLEVLTALTPQLAGKILVDVANATRRDAGGLPMGLLYPDLSLAETLQTALPEVRVVKTLNTMLFSVMSNPAALSAPPTVFVSGNDTAAKDAVRQLLADLGWREAWMQDLGGIASARGTEAMMLLVPHILKARGFVPFALSIAA